MLEEMVVNWGSNNIFLGDTYHIGPVFAWLGKKDDTWVKAHTWTRCRDIIGGYLWGSLLKLDGHCHGGIGWDQQSAHPLHTELLSAVRLGDPDVKSGLTFDNK